MKICYSSDNILFDATPKIDDYAGLRSYHDHILDRPAGVLANSIYITEDTREAFIYLVDEWQIGPLNRRPRIAREGTTYYDPVLNQMFIWIN